MEAKVLNKNFSVSKATEGDKRRALSNAVENNYEVESCGDCYCWSYLQDYDDDYIYFWVSTKDFSGAFKDAYTYDGPLVTLAGEPVEVVATTEYVEVTKEKKEDTSKLDKVLGILEKFIGDSKNTESNVVIKQFDDEEMIAIEPLYAAPDTADNDDEGMTLDTIKGMVESANAAIQEGRLQSKYFHKEVTSDFHFLEAWVNPCDCYIGESFVPEGQPIMKVKFDSEEAWEARKQGELRGLSIGAKATNIVEV